MKEDIFALAARSLVIKPTKKEGEKMNNQEIEVLNNSFKFITNLRGVKQE